MVFENSTTITTIFIITITIQGMSDFVMVLTNSTIMAVLMVMVYKKYVEKAVLADPDTEGLRRQLERYIAVADTSAAENAKLKLSLKAAEAETVKAEAKAKASLAEAKASPTEVVSLLCFDFICTKSFWPTFPLT
jgi:hypothetical protein